MGNRLVKAKRIVAIVFGSFVSSIAVNELIIPHFLLSGGVSGVAIIIQYTTGIAAGALIMIINIPIFIVGIRETDSDFIAYSFIGTAALSIFLIVLKDVEVLRWIRVDDTMLASVFGGVIYGIGSGIVFKNRGSMGGTDIVAVIVKKRRSINIGSVIFLINIAIIGIASILYGVKPAMFTLISMYISSVVLDKVQEGFDRKKSIFIVSEKEDEVAAGILNKLNRGVTFLYGEGAYTKSNRRILYCIVTTRQLAELKHIVALIDSKAFLSVTDIAEVLGKGFKKTEL